MNFYEKTRYVGSIVDSRFDGFFPIEESEGNWKNYRFGYQRGGDDG